MIPERLGRYKILEELGRGAMGIVYLAYDPQIKRKIAIKTFRLDQMVESSEQKEFRTRFQREAQLAGNLSHPNIIAIHDVGEEEGISFIAMELIEGESLAEKMANKYPFAIDEVVEIFSQLCQGMEYAHQKGIIHRDLKPSNILIRKDGLIKIADFGIARALGSTITASHKTLGTPAYMSPEQITGRRIDKRSDIFSLGIILYQMLTGERPFAGETTSTIIYRIINENPIPPRKINLQVPAGFNLIVLKALSKDPAERYQSCQTFQTDIKNYTNLAPTKTLPTIPLSEDRRKVTPLPSKQKNRSRSWIMIPILLAVIVIAAFIIYKTKYKDKDTITENRPILSPQGKEETIFEKTEPPPVSTKSSIKELSGNNVEQEKTEPKTPALIDSNLTFAFGPMPPGKYILRIDGKISQEDNFISLTFLNHLRKNNPNIFYSFRSKLLELDKPTRYKNIYRKIIPISVGQHDISLSLILYTPQIKSRTKKGQKISVRRLQFERQISGHFTTSKGKVLILRHYRGNISLEWQVQK